MSQILKPKKGYKNVPWLFGKEIEMPEEWEVTRQGKVCEFINGYAYSKTEFSDAGYQIIRIQNLTGGKNYVHSNVKLPEKQFAVDGDLLFAWSATFGPFIWHGEKSAFHYHQWKVIPNKLSDKMFLFYHFERVTPTIKNMGQSGLGMFHMTKNGMERFLFFKPPLPEQQKIATILSNIDNLIQNTDKLIEKTNRLKKGLMQKLLTRGIGHTKFKKVSWYYQKEIEIPEEWEVKRITNTGEFINGLNKKKEDYGHGCLHVNIDNIFESFVIDPTKVGRVNATNDEITTYSLQDGDICLLRSSVKREGIGYPALFLKNNKPVVFSGFIIRFRPNQKVWNSFFLTFLLRAEIMRKLVISRSTSSANTNINQPSYGSIQICIPPLPEQQKITSILSNVDSKIEFQTQHKEKLQRLKKSLMQKLLTGQVRVTV